jgi:hypothetical protein
VLNKDLNVAREMAHEVKSILKVKTN